MKNLKPAFFFILTSIVFSISFTSIIKAQTLDDRVNDILSKMTLEEKILQLHHEGGFNTADNTLLGIPGFIMSDGPHGVRDGNATAFPVGIAMAATWDPNEIYKVGLAMGQEFRAKGKNQALGPCMDVTRDPRNGRSPESGGEDSYLISKITSSLIRGIQSTGCIATAKHFNGVNKQVNRTSNNDVISQRLLMEEYGLNFRTAVQDGGVLSVMNSYNLINGEKAAENENLLTNILHNYWGFPTYVVSDWASIWSSEKAIKAGCDVCMGSDNYQNDLLKLVGMGAVPESVIDNAVRRVLKTKILSGMLDYYPSGNPDDLNSNEHQQIALESALKSIVLLKNEDNILPLDKDTINTIALIGPSADVAQVDGSGSSYVTPFYSVSPKTAFENKIGASKIIYAKGCDINSTDMSGFADAVTAAKNADVVVFVGGLDKSQEGEGFDRVGGSIDLPGRQQDLINYLATINKKIIVVLESGGICGINRSINNMKGLLYAFYPGQEGGNAIADVLFGDYNPGGKLPVTMPKTDSQLPAWNADYTDDYGCGYRWFDEKGIQPQFAFGYGISYTTFSFSNLSIAPQSVPAGQIVTVSADVKNTGKLKGDEVVQLYLSYGFSDPVMPKKQLKSFKRVTLEPGETKNVTFKISSEELYYYNEADSSYEVKPGDYSVQIGGSSDNLVLKGNFTIQSTTTKPDLQILRIRTVPRFPAKGDSVLFLADIANRGTGPIPDDLSGEVKFFVNGEEVSDAINFTKPIKPGGMALVCANTGPAESNKWFADKTGKFEISAVVNPNNSIDECIKNNNSFTDYLTVIQQPPKNLALYKKVVASSVESSDYPAKNAVDGSLNTRWSSNFSDPQYLYIDLGSIHHINQVVLNWETAYAKEYFIQVSDDTTNWRDVAHITNGQGGVDKFNFSADARYVRMYGLKRGSEWGYSLFEFQVFNVDTSSGTGIYETSNNNLPEHFLLENNYPNPFNPSTNISYEIPRSSNVKLEIYNAAGKLVRNLINDYQTKGKHSVKWDGKNSTGKMLSSGIYLYRLSTGDLTVTKKMILLK